VTPRRHDDLRGARCLVTGAGGFLGSHLCQRLAAGGAEVHATSRSMRLGGAGVARWWRVDCSDEHAARRLVAGLRPDRLFHLAGQVSAAPDSALVRATFSSLLASTVHLLAAAAESECGRILLVGSLTEPTSVDQPPSSPYAAAKWAAGAYARMFGSLFELPIVIVRPFMTYGPGQHPAKLVPYVTLAALRGEVARISSGRWRADWVYVDDVIDGMLAASTAPDVDGSTLDLGTGLLTATHEVVRALHRIVGTGPEPLFGGRSDRPAERERAADTETARLRLGWSASTRLEVGLRRTVAWYREQLGAARSASLRPSRGVPA
jgi:nucleoside-diphosphate-sugar epimerase